MCADLLAGVLQAGHAVQREELQKPQGSNAAGLYLSSSKKCYDAFSNRPLSRAGATVSEHEAEASRGICTVRMERTKPNLSTNVTQSMTLRLPAIVILLTVFAQGEIIDDV